MITRYQNKQVFLPGYHYQRAAAEQAFRRIHKGPGRVELTMRGWIWVPEVNDAAQGDDRGTGQGSGDGADLRGDDVHEPPGPRGGRGEPGGDGPQGLLAESDSPVGSQQPRPERKARRRKEHPPT